MSRIEEIKERWNKDADPNKAIMAAPDDVRHLLSRLEIADKALTDCKEYDEYANCNWCGGKVKEIAHKALQQIRT